MTKAAQVYKKGSYWYVSTSSKTTSGVWIGGPPRIKIAVGDSAATKGQSVLKALQASQIGVPHPDPADSVMAPLLELAGARSWAAFMKNAACLRVEATEETLTITPYKNLYRRRWLWVCQQSR